MVQRMTDAPARRFGLARRGRIERGWFAASSSSMPTA
jgi:N-acyl-D-aspartate/D-glutamate deacylase